MKRRVTEGDNPRRDVTLFEPKKKKFKMDELLNVRRLIGSERALDFQ